MRIISIEINRTPVVCGIASLGLDHVKILGNTIDQIAWQKAGIFKKNVPAVTAPQLPEAMRVLNERAEEKQVRKKKCIEDLNLILFFFVSVH